MKNLYTTERLFENLFDVRRGFDEMFNRILTPWEVNLREFKRLFNVTPPVEAYMDRKGKKYVCRIALPGVEPKDVQVHTQGNLLTVRGERKLVRTAKEVKFIEEEFAYGVFERTVPLPEGVNTEHVAAEYTNGVLEITAPIAAAALPRKIEIKTVAPAAQQLAA
jgi:HSP20 family molecular chaperone IbpA